MSTEEKNPSAYNFSDIEGTRNFKFDMAIAFTIQISATNDFQKNSKFKKVKRSEKFEKCLNCDFYEIDRNRNSKFDTAITFSTRAEQFQRKIQNLKV